MAMPSWSFEQLEERRLLAAQAYDWNQVAVKGNGYINGVIFSPAPQGQGLAYIHTDMGGAYRWDQSLNKWTSLNSWAPYSDWSTQDLGVEAMAVDPTNASRVYMVAGTYGSPASILRSSDQGRTWQGVSPSGLTANGNGTGRYAGERMMVDPNNPDIIYYGTRTQGLWRSIDAGVNWAKVTAFPVTPGDPGVVWVLYDKNSATPGNTTQTIYAAVSVNTVGNTKIYRSTNGGTSWAALAGQPSNSGQYPMRAALTPDGTAMYVTYANARGPAQASTGQLWKITSPGGAASSAQLTSGIGTPTMSGVAVDPSSPSRVLVGTTDTYANQVYYSGNAGTSFVALNPDSNRDTSSAPYAASVGVHWISDVEFDPFNSAHVMFTTGAGMYSSTDVSNAGSGTVHWTFLDDGFEQTAVLELVSPNTSSSTGDAHVVSAILDRDGFVHTSLTTSPARRFGQNNGMTMDSTDDVDVAFDNANYLVRSGHTFGNVVRVQYSVDGGTTWATWGTVPGGSNGGKIAISKDGLFAIVDTIGAALQYSTRSGSTWSAWAVPTTAGPSSDAKLVADLSAAHTFYAIQGANVYRSTDGGVNWSLMGTGAPSGTTWLRAAPGQLGNLWASTTYSTTNGLWRSTDGGATWTHVNSGAVTTAFVVGVGAGPTPGSYPSIYVGGTVNGTTGFFRSDDQGTTWATISDLSHQFGKVTVIQGDSRVYGRVFVGANGLGVLYGDIHTGLGSLPGGWNTQDLGSPASPGSAGASGGTFELIGAGTGISGTSDSFRFAYQTLSGDATITARVMGVPAASAFGNNNDAKAGVMIRNALTSGSENAFVALTPGSVMGALFQSRSTSGGSTAANGSITTNVWPPYWVRLTRVGNQFTAYASPDGVAWTQIGSPQTISMGSSVNVGLAVTASDSNNVDISQFQNVTIGVPTPPPVATMTPVSPDPRTTSVSSMTITFNQAVSGFDVGDLLFTRDGGSISLAGASLGSGDGGTTWTLSNLSGLSDRVGSYMLTLTAAGSGITGPGGALAANESESWVMNAINGGAGADGVNLVRNGAVTEYRLANVLQYSFNSALLPGLLIFGNGGDDVLTLNYASGDPASTGGTFDGGANTDTLAIVGSGGVDTAVFNNSSVSIGATVNDSAVEKFSFDGNGGGDSLTIDAVSVTSAPATQVLGALSIINGGQLDPGSRNLLVHNGNLGTSNGSPYTGISGLVATGRSGGTWSGGGIITSEADAATPTLLTTLAVASADELGKVGQVWSGQTLAAGDVLVMYTFNGDADLNHHVDVDDYFLIDSNYNHSGSVFGFHAGDFNYDGVIDGDDYLLIDAAFAGQGGP